MGTLSQWLMVSQFVWAATSFFVMFLSGVVCYKHIREKNIDDTFWFALSLFLSWLGSGVYKVWFGILRIRHLNGDSFDTMVNHWVPFVFSIVVVVGALFHIRMLSRSEYGEKVWTVWLVLMSVFSFFMIHYI